MNYNLPDDPSDPGDGGGGGGGTPAYGYGTLVMSRDFVKLDNASVIDLTVYLNCYSADDLRFSGYVFIDDALVQTGHTNALYDQSNSRAQGTMTIPAILEGIGAGYHVISVRIKNRENEATLDVLPGSLIKAFELFQAAR